VDDRELKDAEDDMAKHVFISYAREDQTYTRELADHLRERGFDVWMDDRIDFGDRWWRTIVRALRASAAFVVVMTPESEKSEWVEREVLLALRERRPIFPLLLRGEGFSILIDTQYADVTGGRMPPEEFYDRLRQALAVLEAPEPVPARQPFEPETVLIPAGEFLMGSNPRKHKAARDNEQPQHALYLPDYYIARTPVTNAQYLAFVQATGYEQPGHWKGGKPPAGKGDHPVVNVSWHDAVAYCNWLSEITGRDYRLPSEAEWEKAARGTDGRIYPWGNKWDARRCNSKEGGKKVTMPVGAYPQGASPYGLLDMAGNVREWTRSLWGESILKPGFGYPYDPRDGREDLEAGGFRVLRGGAFVDAAVNVRCAHRDWFNPDSRLRYLGFRVVASPVHL
jgi:formylglycine-generating enzyme required for sulfatase activity